MTRCACCDGQVSVDGKRGSYAIVDKGSIKALWHYRVCEICIEFCRINPDHAAAQIRAAFRRAVRA